MANNPLLGWIVISFAVWICPASNSSPELLMYICLTGWRAHYDSFACCVGAETVVVFALNFVLGKLNSSQVNSFSGVLAELTGIVKMRSVIHAYSIGVLLMIFSCLSSLCACWSNGWALQSVLEVTPGSLTRASCPFLPLAKQCPQICQCTTTHHPSVTHFSHNDPC